MFTPQSSPTSPIDTPFLKDLGMEFLSMEKGEASVALELLPKHMNGWNATHGGVTMTLLDVVMSLAGRSLHPEARGGVTVEMKTSFLRPCGTAGGRLIAKGKVFHQSMTLCFCDGEVWCGDKLVAKAMGTFKYLKRLDMLKKTEHSLLLNDSESEREQTASINSDSFISK